MVVASCGGCFGDVCLVDCYPVLEVEVLDVLSGCRDHVVSDLVAVYVSAGAEEAGEVYEGVACAYSGLEHPGAGLGV